MKLRPDVMTRLIFNRIGVRDPAVLMGPAIGEDSAIVDLGQYYLVAHSDPITGAVTNTGWLSVHVASNDVSVRGAKPRWLLPVILLPEGSGENIIDSITAQIDIAAREVEAMVVGGHTEYTPGIDRPIISMTALGLVEKDKLVVTGGAKPGDYIIMTKTAAIEGTSILAHDFADKLIENRVPLEILERARQYSTMIGVVKEALTLAEGHYATSMHDPTEGGIIGGLTEIAYASKKTLEVWEDGIPVSEETKIICNSMKVDPLKLISSGVLIATIPKSKAEEALRELGEKEFKVGIIGAVKEYNGVLLELHRRDGGIEKYDEVHVEDELMRLISEEYKT